MNINVINELIVVKRSGQRVNFNPLKIAVAIKSAFDSVLKNYSEKDINKIYEKTLEHLIANYQNRKTINVEDIQDVIESTLKHEKYYDVYESFSKYRIRRAESRKAFALKQQHKFVKAIEKIGTNKSLNERPNQILTNFGETISKEYIKSYLLDNKYVRAIEEGKIYIHNLSYLFLGYLSSANIMIDDKEIINLKNTLLNLKEEVTDDIRISNFDQILSNYALNLYRITLKEYLNNYLELFGYKSYVNIKKINEKIDEIETFDFDLQILSNLFANPLSNYILKHAKDDTLKKVIELISSFLNDLFKTINNNNIKYIFSIGLFNTYEGIIIRNIITKEINNQKNLDNVLIVYKIKDGSKNIDNITKLILNYKNVYLDFIDKDNKNIGKLNIATTSINIARLGLEYKTLNNKFYESLDEVIELAKNELLFAFETIGDKSKNNYKILFNNNILDDEKLENDQKIRKVIKNGTLNINLIGLKECALEIDKDNKYEVILKILKHLNNKINDIIKTTKLNFTLSSVNYNTESTSLINLDKTIFGLINNVTNKKTYDEINAIKYIGFKEKLDFVSKSQKLLNGDNTCFITFPKNITEEKIKDTINLLLKSNVSFANMKVEDDN